MPAGQLAGPGVAPIAAGALIATIDGGAAGWPGACGPGGAPAGETVLIFPGLCGLGSQVGQFLQISGNFEHERKRFNTLLGPEKPNQIVDNRVTRAKKRYWRWFGFTVVGYTIAIAGGIVAAIVVPSVVA